LKMFVERANAKLVSKKTKSVTKIAVASTLDLEAGEIVQKVIHGNLKKLDMKPMEGKVIKPLYLFLDKEILLYAKLKKLKYKKNKGEKNKILEFVDELEVNHPEIKRAIVKGLLKYN